MKKLIALVLAVLMVITMAAIFSFADDTRDYEGTTYTKLDGYVTLAGHKPEKVYVDGKYVNALAYDFDVDPVKSADFWDKKDSITFTVVFTPAGGTAVTVVEKPIKAKVYNDAGTDTSLWFALPDSINNVELTLTVYIKTADAAYYVEEAGIAAVDIPELPENKTISGDIECDAGKVTYKYDKDTGVLVIEGDGAAEIKNKDNYTDYPYGEIASFYAKKIYVKGVKKVGKAMFAHFQAAKAIYFAEGTEELGFDCFAYSTIETVYLPKSLVTVNQGTGYSSDIAHTYYAGTDNDLQTLKAGNTSAYNKYLWTYANADGTGAITGIADIVVTNTPVPTGDVAVIATIVAVVALAAMAVVVKKVRV